MADQLAGALRAGGADLLFGVPGGGANLDMVGAAEAVGCRFILTHTETAATIMAGVVAELTGRPSASVATRGPGAASAVNGAAQALLDRQPMLVITDCVTTSDRDRVSHQRLDHRQMMGAVTKASVLLGPHDTAATAGNAVALATSGRPGPVHVDVDPTAPALSPPALSPPARYDLVGSSAPSDASALELARAALRRARRPVVVAGVGAVTGPRRLETVEALRRFVEPATLPVLTTYKARGAVPDTSPSAAGLATGAAIEAPLLDEADLIVGVGLDPVELIPGPWRYQAPVVLLGSWPIDDSTFFGDRLAAEVVGDLRAILDDLAADVEASWEHDTAARHCETARSRLLRAVPRSPSGLTPQQVVSIARKAAPPGTIATVDAGAHMLVAMPLWEVEQPGELLISSGLATMGFALPAAVAAALVHPDRHVVCFTGDGGIEMALAELETLARLRLRVVVVVFNDSTLSLIAIKQKAERQGGARAVRYAATSFCLIGEGFGLASVRVEDARGYDQALRDALTRDGPTLLDVSVDPSAYPEVIEVIRGTRGASVVE